MGNGNVRQQDRESGQNSSPGTKRFPGSNKRFPGSNKGFSGSRQRIDEFATSTDEVNPGDSEAGTGGNYVVKLAEGTEIRVQGAICIRVLPNGELNLLTDEGQWFLFARDAWKSASPEQPSPR